MAKGFISTGDPERQTIYGNLPDGNYVVDGIEKFIGPDGTDEPCFVPMNNTLVVRFKFHTPNGAEGPAASCTAAEYWMLVNALGVEKAAQTAAGSVKARMSPDALIRGQAAMNGKKTLTVEASNGGWANKLRYQLFPPEGKYKVMLVKAHRPDYAEDDLTFQTTYNKWTKKDEEQLVLEFEIVGNSQGKPTLYDGYVTRQYITNPFVPETTTIDGVRIVAKEKGCPLFGHTTEGGEVPGAFQWKVFWQYFAPEALEHDWQVDELDQPQILIIKDALKEQIPVTITWRKKEKSKNGNYGFTWKDIALENDLPETEEDETEEADDKPFTWVNLTDYIKAKWKDIDIFEQTENGEVVFTEAGRSWAKEFLSPAWVKAGLDINDRKPLHQLNGSEVDHLLRAFKSIHGEVGQASGW